jgi:ABC-type branched-subunit amino acid transport system ATPase component
LRLRRSRRLPLTATPVVELQQVALGPLRSFDLVVYAGERVGVLGEAGSGKTVLAELVAGARQPERGRVRRDGIDVTASATWAGELAAGSGTPGSRGNAASGVAWLAQEPRPFRRLTVFENVLVAALAVPRRSTRVAEAFARRALSRLDLDLVADRLPARLTPSQLARVEAARALAAPRRLVVVDQLSQRVDQETAAEVRAALGETVAEGAAILWLASPDTPPADVDRLVVLAYGRVAEEGPAEQVLATSKLSRGRRTPAGVPTSNGTATSATHPPAGTAAPTAGDAATAGSTTGVKAASAILRVREWTAPDRAHPIVDGFSLDVQRGELLVVVGENDEQVTVLLRSLAGLVEALGRLWLRDRELSDLGAAARARAGMALVPRDGAVVDRLTVAEHLVLAGARRRRRRWSTRAIYQMVPSLGMARHRPAGVLPPLERRCLALARALVADPPALLVDRPAHGVPAPISPVLSELLMEASRSAAVVVGDVADGPGTALGGRMVYLAAGGLGTASQTVRSG